MEGLTESVILSRPDIGFRCYSLPLAAEQPGCALHGGAVQRDERNQDCIPAAEQPGCVLHSGAVQRDERNQDCIPAAEQPGCVLHSGAVQRDQDYIPAAEQYNKIVMAEQCNEIEITCHFLGCSVARLLS